MKGHSERLSVIETDYNENHKINKSSHSLAMGCLSESELIVLAEIKRAGTQWALNPVFKWLTCHWRPTAVVLSCIYFNIRAERRSHAIC